MKFNVLTLFPEMFKSFLESSIIGRAVNNKIIDVELINFRRYSNNKHKKVDDYTYGGGAGMLLTPQPLFDALDAIDAKSKRVIYLSPKGKTFTQIMANSLANEEEIILICGHYEGIDQRVIDEYVTDEISIGDYVLTGGEIPAMILIDAISRLKEGVLSSSTSFEDETFYSGLLEYPQYTRPSNFRGLEVPKVLLSGNHEKIREWRLEKSIELTKERRYDLYERYVEQNHMIRKEK